MRTAILFTLILSFALAGAAQGTQPAAPVTPAPAMASGAAPLPDAKVDALAVDLKAMSRILELAKNYDNERPLLLAFLADNIEKFREPRGDGTYRWASLQRIEDGRVKEEKGIDKVSTEQTLNTVTVSAARAFRLVVTVPEKRNLVNANNKVFIRNVVIDSTSFDGKLSRTELPINVWVNPKDSHGVALPDISKSSQATVELGVESGSKKAVAQVALLQAKLVDDPTGPYYNAVQRMLQVQSLVSSGSMKSGELKNVVDEAILNIPGEMQKRMAAQEAEAAARKAAVAGGQTTGAIAVGDATPDVIEALGRILTMSKGNIDEQAQSRAQLEQLVMALRPPVTTAPVNK